MTNEPLTFEQIRTRLYSAVIADALDAAGYRNQCLGKTLSPRTVIANLAGRCRTTQWEDIDFEDPEPYKIELEAVDDCQPDDVLIAAADSSMKSGIWGELLSTASRQRGCVGAIVDGAVRDLAPMRKMKFPVYAAGVSPYDSLHRQRVVSRDEPVEIGGVTIVSGDFVFADEDGVVIVPHKVEGEVLAAAWKKVHDENEVRDAIGNGMTATAAFKKYGVL